MLYVRGWLERVVVLLEVLVEGRKWFSFMIEGVPRVLLCGVL